MKKIILIILFIVQALEIHAQSPRFSFASDSLTLELSQKTKTAVFKVYKGAYETIDEIYGKNAVLGDFNQNDSKAWFIPILPFQKNKDYTIIYKNQVYPFKIAIDPSYTLLQVDTIYPNATTLPSNFLKWYIRFSKPVNPSKIYDHISLLNNQTNTIVDRALLPLETPLLSNDGTLLTLWIEPGRQKRDLGPNKRLGEVLIEGNSYTLIIDKELKDNQGISMHSDFKHSFTVNAPDRSKPTITSWEITLPASNTKEALQIHFQEFMDYGSLKNAIIILDQSGALVEGDFTLKTNKNIVNFKPITIWNKNNYIIKYEPIIEDISGNNLERLFDRDITKKTTPPILERSFTIE